MEWWERSESMLTGDYETRVGENESRKSLFVVCTNLQGSARRSKRIQAIELLMRCTWVRPYWCRSGPRLCRAAAGQISGGSRCLVFCKRDCAAAQWLHG
jgi:hypothetical protein